MREDCLRMVEIAKHADCPEECTPTAETAVEVAKAPALAAARRADQASPCRKPTHSSPLHLRKRADQPHPCRKSTLVDAHTFGSSSFEQQHDCSPHKQPPPPPQSSHHSNLARPRAGAAVNHGWYRMVPTVTTVVTDGSSHMAGPGWPDPDGPTCPTWSHAVPHRRFLRWRTALSVLCVTYSYGGDKWACRLAIAHTTKSGQGHHDTPNATTYMYSVTPNDTCTLNPRTSTTLARPTHNHKTAPCSMGVDPRHAKCENELSSSVVRSAAVSPPPTVAVSVYQYNYNCIITISTRHHLPRCVRRSQR